METFQNVISVDFQPRPKKESKMLLIKHTDLDDTNRCEELRELYKKHVQHPDGHWKGRAVAYVDPEIASSVAEAMDFMGSIVQSFRNLKSGKVKLYSKGYWANGF
jgi:hypothetical protein